MDGLIAGRGSARQGGWRAGDVVGLRVGAVGRECEMKNGCVRGVGEAGYASEVNGCNIRCNRPTSL